MIKKYSIPVVWESQKRYQVEAENLQEAITKALREFLKEPDDNYLDNSFYIDDIVSEEYKGEFYNVWKAINDL